MPQALVLRMKSLCITIFIISASALPAVCLLPSAFCFLPSAFCPYRSFNVERLNNANRIAIIKKRKTIFDSFQSCISK